MKNFAPRSLALFLSLGLCLPGPAWGLRQTGLEENDELANQLATRLKRSTTPAGLEELPMDPAEAAAHVRWKVKEDALLRQVDASLLILRGLRAGQRSLHVGNGTSFLPVAEALMGLEVFGVDLQENNVLLVNEMVDQRGMRKELTQRGGKFDYTRADVRTAVIPGTGQIDHIVAIDLFAGTTPWSQTDAEAILKRISGWVGPGSTVLITGPIPSPKGPPLSEGFIRIDGQALLRRELKRKSIRFRSFDVTKKLPAETADGPIWLFRILSRTPASLTGLEENLKWLRLTWVADEIIHRLDEHPSLDQTASIFQEAFRQLENHYPGLPADKRLTIQDFLYFLFASENVPLDESLGTMLVSKDELRHRHRLDTLPQLVAFLRRRVEGIPVEGIDWDRVALDAGTALEGKGPLPPDEIKALTSRVLERTTFPAAGLEEPPPVHVRPLRRNDFDRILEIQRAIWDAAREADTPLAFKLLGREPLKGLVAGDTRYPLNARVAELRDNHGVVGFLIFELVKQMEGQQHTSSTYRIRNLGVEPQHQRQGAASRMVLDFFEVARAHGERHSVPIEVVVDVPEGAESTVQFFASPELRRIPEVRGPFTISPQEAGKPIRHIAFKIPKPKDVQVDADYFARHAEESTFHLVFGQSAFKKVRGLKAAVDQLAKTKLANRILILPAGAPRVLDQELGRLEYNFALELEGDSSVIGYATKGDPVLKRFAKDLELLRIKLRPEGLGKREPLLRQILFRLGVPGQIATESKVREWLLTAGLEEGIGEKVDAILGGKPEAELSFSETVAILKELGQRKPEVRFSLFYRFPSLNWKRKAWVFLFGGEGWHPRRAITASMRQSLSDRLEKFAQGVGQKVGKEVNVSMSFAKDHFYTRISSSGTSLLSGLLQVMELRMPTDPPGTFTIELQRPSEGAEALRVERSFTSLPPFLVSLDSRHEQFHTFSVADFTQQFQSLLPQLDLNLAQVREALTVRSQVPPDLRPIWAVHLYVHGEFAIDEALRQKVKSSPVPGVRFVIEPMPMIAPPKEPAIIFHQTSHPFDHQDLPPTIGRVELTGTLKEVLQRIETLDPTSIAAAAFEPRLAPYLLNLRVRARLFQANEGDWVLAFFL